MTGQHARSSAVRRKVQSWDWSPSPTFSLDAPQPKDFFVGKSYSCKLKIPTRFSDGLGFTGVYIALDIGIMSHEESKTSVVDVFELSKNLRRERHGIVCSLNHYNFIYQVRITD